MSRRSGTVLRQFSLSAAVGRHCLIAALLLASAGCVANGADDEDGSRTFHLGWLIGGVAMAVDGDDRDDHTGWFDDDDECECRHK